MDHVCSPLRVWAAERASDRQGDLARAAHVFNIEANVFNIEANLK